VIEKMLAKGADVNATDQKHRSTALMWAAHNGHTEALKVLIRSGAAIDARREKGETALWFAAQKGQLETLKILVENGAKTDVVGRDGETAVAIAEKNGHTHVVDYLKRIGGPEQAASN
jgi:ankyrin repeat protein